MGGVGEYHRQRGQGINAPIDVPAHRSILDAEVTGVSAPFIFGTFCLSSTTT